MITRTFNFTGHDGKQYSDTYHFHLSEADILEMEISAVKGENSPGLAERLILIGQEKDGKEIMKHFKEIILASVGRKDGKRFVRTDEIRDEFYQTDAYSQLFKEIVTDTDGAINFVNGIMPGNVSQSDLQAIADAQKAGKTPSEIARAASEARLKGHQPKTQADKNDAQEQAALIPTAPPMLEPTTPDGETIEEMKARIRREVLADMEAEQVRNGGHGFNVSAPDDSSVAQPIV